MRRYIHVWLKHVHLYFGLVNIELKRVVLLSLRQQIVFRERDVSCSPWWLWNCSAFLWLACLRDEWMIDHDSSPLWQCEVSTRELSDGSPETFMGTQLLWISIMHVMYERAWFFLSQIISKPFSIYYTFHEIYL